jgi:hypothetical protein
MLIPASELLIEKGIITQQEFMQKIADERGDIPTNAEPNIAAIIQRGLVWSRLNSSSLV